MPPFATTCPRASHLLSRRCKISYARPALPHTRVAVREVFSHQHSGVSQFLSQDRIRKIYRFQLNRQHSSPCYAASTLAADPQGADDATEAVLLDVSGMKCGGCSAAVKRILMESADIKSAAVNLLTESAVFKVPANSDKEALGAKAASLLTKQGFPSKIRDPEQGMLGDTEKSQQAKQAELQKSILDLGIAWSLALICCTHHLGHWLHGLGLHQVAHLPVLNTMHQTFSNPAASAALGAVALLGPGRKLLVDGALSLARGNPNMNSLIGLGAATSFTAGSASLLLPGAGLEVGFLEEPVMLLAFVLLGRALETRARLKASADLQTLAKLIPAQSRMVINPASLEEPSQADNAPELDLAMVPTSNIRPGDVLRVLPGERMPVDGDIFQGKCSVDESMLTGESVPVPKTKGQQVTAGTVNYEGPITIKATSTGTDSTLAGIGRLVADAQAREAPVQRLADAVAGKFCYSVMAASAATFGFWSLAGPSLFPGVIEAASMSGASASAALLGLKLAVDVMVVACPCALGLATPTAVLVASSMGAQRGLLLRGGDVLERMAHINVVAFDKTGTLTQGKMRLVGTNTAQGQDESELLRLAAAVEGSTRHPLADAVLLAANKANLQVPQAQDSTTEPGCGVTAIVEGQTVAVGRLDWVQHQIRIRSHSSASSSSTTTTNDTNSNNSDGSSQNADSDSSIGSGMSGQSVVYVGLQGQGVIGALGFSDTLRPDSQYVVQQLHSRGIRVVVLSGDTQEAVTVVAQQAGVDPKSAWGGVSPKQKGVVVQQLQRQSGTVAMVGDGVNDAPALAAADVGIAMSGGMDAAGEAASVVLMGDRLGQVVEAIDLGCATYGKIKQNLAWALVYNLIGIPLAAGALLPQFGIALSPSVAGGMMAFSSLAVVSNSLLLRAQFSGKAKQQQKFAQQDQQPLPQG
ncbi:TPA: hypothetical protein ACH3X2_002698 [Trebouxia sp. C0005]